jgi:hypothetical protein
MINKNKKTKYPRVSPSGLKQKYLIKMIYCNFGTENITRILVAGGGLDNGNDCAFIEFLTDDPDTIWYVEYGKNPIRKIVGYDGIWWDDDGTFNVRQLPEFDDDSAKESDDDCPSPRSVLPNYD